MKLDTTLPYLLCFSVISFFFCIWFSPRNKSFMFCSIWRVLCSCLVLCCAVLFCSLNSDKNFFSSFEISK